MRANCAGKIYLGLHEFNFLLKVCHPHDHICVRCLVIQIYDTQKIENKLHLACTLTRSSSLHLDIGPAWHGFGTELSAGVHGSDWYHGYGYFLSSAGNRMLIRHALAYGMDYVTPPSPFFGCKLCWYFVIFSLRTNTFTHILGLSDSILYSKLDLDGLCLCSDPSGYY